MQRAVIASLLLALGCAGAPVSGASTEELSPAPEGQAAAPGPARDAVPEPPPPYPLRVARLDDAAIAEAERAFRERTGEPWTEVRIDPYGGLLRAASIVEPEPSAFPDHPTYDEATMQARWSRFLAAHGAPLALDAPGTTPLPEHRDQVGFQQVWGGQVVGWAMVSWSDVGYSDRVWRAARVTVSGHGWPRLPAEPALQDEATAASSLVGRTGTRVLELRFVPMPCDPPGGARVNPCLGRPVPPTPPPVRVPYALTARDVIVNPPTVCRLVVDGGAAMELRLVRDVMVRLQPAASDVVPEGFVGGAGFVPDAPLPSRVDAVTGEALEGTCDF